MTGAEKQRAERIARYEAAYSAAHGESVRCVYRGQRYRIGSFTFMTGPELDRATERLEQRAKEGAKG